eukprot:gb/GFBE01060220.1/.p1 GENE.gb/GFBE01060220.1/~~gb/GFBE01060220.1/.p1  ORF type:complete len:329 (+),score=76.03 gb/GFBE01060220.1/:1-987(+)
MDETANTFFETTTKLRPTDLGTQRQRLDKFVAAACSAGKKIALITSGGTTVPLELNTVRFIDNFSSGTRGALCTQEFLGAGYAVVFLHRKGSNFPFATELVKKLNEAPVDLLAGSVTSSPLAPADVQDRLLAVGFTTIFEYLFLLRECCQSVAQAGSAALVLLAAAVSDFYVPEVEMSTEKIQSRAHDGLTIQLRNVPKLLGAVRLWSPKAFVISFKLETNANILLAKAAGSLKKYGVDAVCSNQLQSIRDLVTIIEPDPAVPTIQISKAEIAGDEEEPIEVEGVASHRVVRGDSKVVEVPLVSAIVDRHGKRMAASAEDQPAKRSRK